MQGAPRPAGQPTSVKIYNAVYSSVQVYECMVRGIAVMRRRADSYVNATQILKVAGVDKGRRTKILEKEVLPGKHEIVQGGYGKYQGTWIPLERGRELALQYGIAPLLSPLFDFIPNATSMSGLPNPLPNLPGLGGGRPLSGSASFSGIGSSGTYSAHQLGPAPIMPGSALRLLNQGRAQGLFTPSTSSLLAKSAGVVTSPGNYYPGIIPGHPAQTNASAPASPHQQLKRTRTDSELETLKFSNGSYSHEETPSTPSPAPMGLAASPDIVMSDAMRPPSVTPSDSQVNGGPSPTKRARTVPPTSYSQLQGQMASPASRPQSRAQTSTPQPPSTAISISRPGSSASMLATGQPVNGVAVYDHSVRLATRPSEPRSADKSGPLKNNQRSAVMAAICHSDNPASVIESLREASIDPININQPHNQLFDVNIVIDDLGHTSLHLAASLGRIKTLEMLISNGADIHRGNYQGETALIRAALSTHNFDYQCFPALLDFLHASIRTIDTAKRSVLHHITASAGVKGRAAYARYYLEGVLTWIAQNEGGDFRTLVDLQDEHGDTALNIAARVGNRSLVRSLMDVGANRILANKLGLRPGDFGVEPEELAGGPRAEDLLSSLRTGPSIPAQKSQDVIADMTNMIQSLTTDFNAEIKSKQDTFDVTQAHLRAATRELADQRRQIQGWQARCGELDQVTQRIRNMEKAMAEEDKFDWTGRTELTGEPANAGPSFAFRGSNSTMAAFGGSIDISFNLEPEPHIPASNSLASLIKLRRMMIWQERIEKLTDARLKGLQGASAEKEFQCKKIVALCAGVPVDQVEDMLENLVIAMESETQVVDIGRVSGFMQKVRDGVI
ncbi:hypothetical protein BD410DRAFT_768110 [Rickenella mellea]|uniref:HTH APSES-type domain-containing protein n=1 Tax=Rickenella mellea TaxID=50990 RepID=A0A4Y7Q8H6_9AGAM|nr:hypothetical protein BD410DRAFT_768110 [Rickenella mellea]